MTTYYVLGAGVLESAYQIDAADWQTAVSTVALEKGHNGQVAAIPTASVMVADVASNATTKVTQSQKPISARVL